MSDVILQPLKVSHFRNDENLHLNHEIVRRMVYENYLSAVSLQNHHVDCFPYGSYYSNALIVHYGCCPY